MRIEVTTDRHHWKIQAIEVVAKVEHFRKSRTCELTLAPTTGRISIRIQQRICSRQLIQLRAAEPRNRARKISVIGAVDLLQHHRRPRGLARSRRTSALQRGVRVTVRALAETSICFLNRLHPCTCAQNPRLLRRHAAAHGTNHRLPCSVDVVHAPSAKETSVDFLPRFDERDCRDHCSMCL